jgi:hypothetical protein
VRPGRILRAAPQQQAIGMRRTSRRVAADSQSLDLKWLAAVCFIVLLGGLRVGD